MTRPLTIRLASVGEIEQCFPIMSQLRLHLKADNFIQQVRSQMTAGYQLAYISDRQVVVVAGFNIATRLA